LIKKLENFFKKKILKNKKEKKKKKKRKKKRGGLASIGVAWPAWGWPFCLGTSFSTFDL